VHPKAVPPLRFGEGQGEGLVPYLTGS
jgi:hypothetical protein